MTIKVKKSDYDLILLYLQLEGRCQRKEETFSYYRWQLALVLKTQPMLFADKAYFCFQLTKFGSPSQYSLNTFVSQVNFLTIQDNKCGCLNNKYFHEIINIGMVFSLSRQFQDKSRYTSLQSASSLAITSLLFTPQFILIHKVTYIFTLKYKTVTLTFRWP